MTPPSTFKDLVDSIIELTQLAVPVVASLALLVFFWGLAKFMVRLGGDEKAVAEGKNLMIWGLIALFIMVSVWGIISFFYGDFGFSSDRPFALPFLPTN